MSRAASLHEAVLRAMAALALCFGAAVGLHAQSGQLRAGAAKVDITPTGAGVLMTPTDVIRDHLFVRAIVADNGHTCAVLIGIDISKADDSAVSNGIARASAATGCPAAQFLVSATHTHSSSTYGVGNVTPMLPSAKTQEDAIVAASTAAKAALAPARVGYATAPVHLNVNREQWDNQQQRFVQGPALENPSDKTLSVVVFMGTDDVPIGVYMNYGMHPINFYLTGVLSADFPGEASRYIERLFGDRTVAIYSQAPEGDQNPLFGEFAASRVVAGEDLVERIGSGKPSASPMRPGGVGFVPGGTAGGAAGAPGAPPPQGSQPAARSGGGVNQSRNPVPPERMEDYRRAINITGANVTMMGTLIAANAVRLIRDVIKPVDTVRIWGARDAVTCPGTPRAGETGPPPVRTIPMGLVRIGDIYWVPVNAELYNEIGTHLREASPASRTIVVALGYGGGGYIRSDNSNARLPALPPGAPPRVLCGEESKIITKALELIQRSGN